MFADDLIGIDLFALLISITAFVMALGAVIEHLNRRKVRRDIADYNSRPEVLRGEKPRIDDGI